ncbi:MAG TPA: OmpA family protein [Bdellovibrionales bacterium]|nr:OmpA family protein [Bdellovibrionales bacterium]
MNKKNAVMIFAAMSLGLAGCSSAGKNTAIGAGAGAAAGGVLGAVIGHQTGNRAGGALIGAALGGAMGGVVGNRLDKQAKELEQVAETKRTENGIVSKLKSDILFDTGKSDLKASSDANLKKMAGILKKYPENVLTIRGYTDSTGSDKINQPLSEKRASAVKSKLVAGGVPANAVTVVGMGPANPIGDNATAEGRSQNRRVEVEIKVDESKVPKDAK